jgi:hypothetical protein
MPPASSVVVVWHETAFQSRVSSAPFFPLPFQLMSPENFTRLRRKPRLPGLRSRSCFGGGGSSRGGMLTGVLRSLGEGGHASADSAEETKGTTAVKPWGSTHATRTCR